MIDREELKILESEWVCSKRDKNGEETWGYELVEGAPKEVREELEELMRAFDFEDRIHGYK